MLLIAAVMGCGGVEQRTPPGEPFESPTEPSPAGTTCDADEVCNGLDDDCNGLADDADPGVDLSVGPYWFQDLDGDGFGAGEPFASCVAPPQSAAGGMDCDDTDPEQHPGANWYVDSDGDTYGDPKTRIQQCLRPDDEAVTLGGDCDDENPRAAPGIDWHADEDEDGHGDPFVQVPSCSDPDPRVDNATDCDDDSSERHPGADEVCDGIDDDCDGVADDGVVPTWYFDGDGDEWGNSTGSIEQCTEPAGFVPAGGDCDDSDSAVHPEAVETCDDVDNDCDGSVDQFGVFGAGLEVQGPVLSALYGDVGDLDGDGDPDVVATDTSGDDVLWIENLADGTFVEHELAALTEASDMRLADLDQDGAVDLIACSFDAIGWYRNEGAGAFGERTIVKEDVNGYPFSPVAADLDEDGDPDLLVAWWTNYEATWHENLGGGVFGPEVVISGLPNHPEDVRAADLDLDGDLDVVVGSRETDTLSWNENLGAGAFGPDQVITEFAWGTRQLEMADVDGDGDPDLVTATEDISDDRIVWYENVGGGVFDADPRLIMDGLWYLPALHVADLDGDADPDVIVGEDNAEDLEWYENLGAGEFGPVQAIVDLETPRWAAAADVDGDGLMDIVASLTGASARIEWFPGQSETCP